MTRQRTWLPISALSKTAAVAAVALSLLPIMGLKTASALTINRNFITSTAPTTSAGGGNIVDIFNTAADWWEASILDTHTLNIDFFWTDLPDTRLADALALDPIRISDGTVRFDNSRTDWFLDATPNDDDEYQSFTETSQDLGGGVVNTGRRSEAFFGDPSGRFDLLTVAAHEIGHLLGVLNLIGNPLPDPLLITGPRPNAGTSLTTLDSHLSDVIYPDAVMSTFVNRGIRNALSAIDILAAAERSNFADLNLDPLADPIAVAEPAPLAVLTLGLLTTIALRRRKTVEIQPFGTR